MVIDGKALASQILDELKKRVVELEKKGVIPHLAVILVGNDASSELYVKQKRLKGERIGAKLSVFTFQNDIPEKNLLNKIYELNNDATIHGIIVQRPLPRHIDGEKVTKATAPEKDVDGFHPHSPFTPPIALAVWKILEKIKAQSPLAPDLTIWLQNKQIVILGKGQTAGQPIIHAFQKRNIPHTVVDSKTKNKGELLRQADIVISAIGKPHILRPNDIKDEAILIGVGMNRGEDGRMHPDYDEDLIKDKVSFYTPVPGGVGPVNVAMLLSNLLLATNPKKT